MSDIGCYSRRGAALAHEDVSFLLASRALSTTFFISAGDRTGPSDVDRSSRRGHGVYEMRSGAEKRRGLQHVDGGRDLRDVFPVVDIGQHRTPIFFFTSARISNPLSIPGRGTTFPSYGWPWS